MQDGTSPDIERVVATLKEDYVLIPKKKIAWIAGALTGFVAVNFGGSWATALQTAGAKLGQAFEEIDDVAAATREGFETIDRALPQDAPARPNLRESIQRLEQVPARRVVTPVTPENR